MNILLPSCFHTYPVSSTLQHLYIPINQTVKVYFITTSILFLLTALTGQLNHLVQATLGRKCKTVSKL